MDGPASTGNDRGGVDGDPGVCGNCARDDDELVAVRRIYVVPESWDTAGSSTTMDEVELWCFSCRSMYPHEQVADDED